MLAYSDHSQYNDGSSPHRAVIMIKQKTDLLLGFWRQAYESPVTLNFATYKKANSFRLRLYVAVRPYRTEANGDVELHCKINQMEAIAKELPDGTGQLVIRSADLNEELAELARQAGLPWGFNRAEAEESQRRMLERVEEINAPEAGKPTFDYVTRNKPIESKPEEASDVGDDYSDEDRRSIYDD